MTGRVRAIPERFFERAWARGRQAAVQYRGEDEEKCERGGDCCQEEAVSGVEAVARVEPLVRADSRAGNALAVQRAADVGRLRE